MAIPYRVVPCYRSGVEYPITEIFMLGDKMGGNCFSGPFLKRGGSLFLWKSTKEIYISRPGSAPYERRSCGKLLSLGPGI